MVASGPQAGAGVWSNGEGGWWDGTANVTWVAGDTAIFAAKRDGAYSVVVGSNIVAGHGTEKIAGLQFAGGGYTLSADASRQITLGTTTANSYVSVSPGKSATIGTNVKLEANQAGAQLQITGGGALKIAGKGAQVKSGSNLFIVTGGTSIEVGEGGTLSGANSQIIVGTDAGAGCVVINGGSMHIPTTSTAIQNIVLANNTAGTTSGTLTINSGLVANPNIQGGLRFGASKPGTGVSDATLNLNGGVLKIGRLFEGAGPGNTCRSTVNFNGGVIEVLAASANAESAFITGLDAARVMEGGAIIDTNGAVAKIGQSLVHGGGAAVDGGVTKQGGGVLVLSGANTYTGPTVVKAGRLTVDGAITQTAYVAVLGDAVFTNNGGALQTEISVAEGAEIAGSGRTFATGMVVSADLSDGFTAIKTGPGFGKGGKLKLFLTQTRAGSHRLFASIAKGNFDAVVIDGVPLAPAADGFFGTIGGFAYSYATATDTLLIKTAR